MSKALLKKSLAFVRSGGCEDRERDVSSLKRRESTERKRVRKKASAKSRATHSNKSHLAPDKASMSATEKNMLYFRKREMIKKEVIKTVGQSAVQEKSRVCLTPAELAEERRRLRVERRRKRAKTKKGGDRNPFSIFNIPHFTSS